MWLAAGVLLAGAARAQNNSSFFHHQQGAATNGIAGADLFKTGPKFVLGSGTEVTGLFVDLLKPRQTWLMLNPPVPARDLPKPLPPYLRPVKPLPTMNDDLATHDADFPLLRLNFSLNEITGQSHALPWANRELDKARRNFLCSCRRPAAMLPEFTR